MRAAIMSFGSELLQGFLTDTNATYLAMELSALGVETVGVAQIGDNLDHLTRALQRALDDSDLVVCTGGIGPTADDLTREAIAVVCNEEPRVDIDTLESIRGFFRRRGSDTPERNRKQAWTIPSAEILPNPNGTAPGWFVRQNGKAIVAMPGVPREMMPMWRDQVVPRLLPSLPEQTIATTTLKTIGIGESAAEEAIRYIIERGVPTVSTYAKDDGVHIRIVSVSDRREVAERAVQRAESEIRDALQLHVYGHLEDSLPVVILAPLRDNDQTLALWEAGTGGRVVALLASDPAVATVLQNAQVSTLDIATKELGQAGDVQTIATAMANAISASRHPTYALGIAMQIGPGDASGRHDARIGVAVVSPKGLTHVERLFAAAPAEVQRRSGLLAAEFLRLSILDATTSRPS